jgi:hypothetical protein
MPSTKYLEIEKFALENLQQCSADMEILSTTGVLPAGKFRELFHMIEEENFGTIQTARGLISDLAVRLVAKMPSAAFEQVAELATPPVLTRESVQQSAAAGAGPTL